MNYATSTRLGKIPCSSSFYNYGTSTKFRRNTFDEYMAAALLNTVGAPAFEALQNILAEDA
jgi:hypothetical protein